MKRTLLFFPILFLISLWWQNAKAIPAFARKYRISCKVCHSPAAPRLKSFGNQFAVDGLKLDEYEAPRYFIETGDQELSLMRQFPLAVRIDGFATYNFSGENREDFAAPFGIKIMSGSEISKHLAYYFYFYMFEHGEIAGVEDAYLMYNNLFNSTLDIFLGQFQVSDPLFKRELRLELEDYRLYTARIGLSDITLKYDRGVMLTYSFKSGTGITVEIVNGNGLAEDYAANLFDKDKYKNFLGRISQNVGDHITLGAMAYIGKERITNDFDQFAINDAEIYGPDATISISDLVQIRLQYLLRKDSHVLINKELPDTQDNIHTHGGMGEILFSPEGDDSKWYALGLFNLVESDYIPANYRSGTLHAGYLLRRNVRLAGEYTYVFTESVEPFGKVSVGFVSAF